MAVKNTAHTITCFAWDTNTSTPKTGDAANLSAYYVLDDGSATVVSAPGFVELDATNMPGVYKLDLTAAETNGNFVTVHVTSTTSGVYCSPVQFSTEDLANTVWDEAQSGHTTSGSMGRQMQIASSVVAETILTGTPTSTVMRLTAGSTTDDFYNDMLILFLSGNAAGLSYPILDYTGSTKEITLDETLPVTPSASDAVVIISLHTHSKGQNAEAIWDEVLTSSTHDIANSAGKKLRLIHNLVSTGQPLDTGTVVSASATTAELEAGAPAVSLVGDLLVITGGTGEDQVREISAYDTGTKIATVATWDTTPDGTSTYEVWPAQPVDVTVTGGVTGPGADSVTINILEDDDVTPIADADVWITSDANGNTTIAGTSQTDSNGDVTFLLDAGATYYLWAQKDGKEAHQGTSFVAVAD